jgi:hypothetical protein
MTVAAQEASLLQACLRGGEAHLARRFFKVAKAAIDVAWDIAVGNDLRHPQVQGPRSPKVRFINWYIGKLHMAARRDAVLAKAFLKVANLTMSPAALLHPSVVMRVIYGNVRWRSAASEAGSLLRIFPRHHAAAGVPAGMGRKTRGAGARQFRLSKRGEAPKPG